MVDIITQIVDDVNVEGWVKLQPKVYYKDDKPYGLLATVQVDSVTVVASTVTNPDLPFTIGMLRDIKKLNANGKICLITDVESKQELIRNTLDKYGFRYEYRDGAMLSYNF